MGRLSQEGEGPLAQDCNSGGPGLPFALKTAKAGRGRRIEIACELVLHPESISPSCPPFLLQTQSRLQTQNRQGTAGQNVQSRGT